MNALTFTNPREAAMYWDRFEDRSIRPVQPYLWEWPDGDAEDAHITRINRNELDWMVLDKNAEIRVDAAIWVVHQNTPMVRNVLVLTHKQDPDSTNPWDVEVSVVLTNKTEANNLIKQLSGEVALAFRDED